MSTHNIPFLNIYIKKSQICNYGICSRGLKKEFKTAVVNEPSVLEPLKLYCICFFLSVLSEWIISVQADKLWYNVDLVHY